MAVVPKDLIDEVELLYVGTNSAVACTSACRFVRQKQISRVWVRSMVDMNVEDTL